MGWKWQMTWLVAGWMAACAGADEISIGSAVYRDVYIREGVHMYYLQIPENGLVVSVSKGSVDPHSVIYTADPERRQALLDQWKRKNSPEGLSPAARGSVPPTPAAVAAPEVLGRKVLRAKGNARREPLSPMPDVLASERAGNSGSTMELGDALRAILRPRGLDYAVRGGYVQVSTSARLREQAGGPMETRAYGMQAAGGDSMPKIGMGIPGNGGGNYGGDVTMISNVSDLFFPVDDRLVGEFGPVEIGVGR